MSFSSFAASFFYRFNFSFQRSKAGQLEIQSKASRHWEDGHRGSKSKERASPTNPGKGAFPWLKNEGSISRLSATLKSIGRIPLLIRRRKGAPIGFFMEPGWKKI
jgi:hypothetical protein